MFKDQVITKDAVRVTVPVTDVERMELFKSSSFGSGTYRADWDRRNVRSCLA
jgi:hypothetical protein